MGGGRPKIDRPPDPDPRNKLIISNLNNTDGTTDFVGFSSSQDIVPSILLTNLKHIIY